MIKSTVCCLLALGAACAGAAAPHRLVSASERGTYIQIGKDLAHLVAKPAGIDLEVLPSAGSADNVRRLRYEPGVRLALVQSDVYQAFIDEARAGNTEAARLIKPLKVVLPLYNEEIYFVTRADSPLNHIHEIKDKRINIGPVGSGSALSATTLYRQMFGMSIPQQNVSFLSNEEALLKLATDSSIEVAVIVAGQPAKLFAEMKPQAQQLVKLLSLEPQAAETRAAAGTYAASAIRFGSYPAWLSEDVPTFTTKALLVTYDYQSPDTQQMLTRFARSLCVNFDRLKSEGHAKWQEVGFGLPPLGKDWLYYGPTEKELVACNAARNGGRRTAGPTGVVPASCSQAQTILGLCRP
jgi:uncharacterized protein